MMPKGSPLLVETITAAMKHVEQAFADDQTGRQQDAEALAGSGLVLFETQWS